MTTLGNEALAMRADRSADRLAALHLPDVETIATFGGVVVLGASILVHQTAEGRGELTMLDPRMGVDRRLIAELPTTLAPQPLRHRSTLGFVTHGTERHVGLSIARQPDRDMLGALSGDRPLRVEDHLGLLQINGEQISPKTAMLLAKCVAVLGQKGPQGLARHLEIHEHSIRLARS